MYLSLLIFSSAYALVLSGNHVYTSGAGGTNAAAIRGALRAEQDDLLTAGVASKYGKANQGIPGTVEKGKRCNFNATK